MWLSAARTASSNGASLAVTNFDWIRPVARGVVVATRGSLADCEELFSLLQAHCLYRELEEGPVYEASAPFPAAEDGVTVHGGADVVQVANLCRRIVSNRLFQYRQGRAPSPMNAEIIVAGSAVHGGRRTVQLFWLDSIGSMKEIAGSSAGSHSHSSGNNCCVHADAATAPMIYSLLHELLRSEQMRSDGLSVVRRCWTQLRQRSAGYTPVSLLSDAVSVSSATVDASRPIICWKIDSLGEIHKLLMP